MSSLIASLAVVLVLAVTTISQDFISADDLTRALESLPAAFIQAWPKKYEGIG